MSAELSQLKQLAIKSYRHLLRAQRKVFASDERTLNQALNKSRGEFEANKNLSDIQILKQKIDEANQITQFLEKNLVQGVLQRKESNPTIKVKIDERVEMWDYSKNGRPTCGCC